MGHYWPPWNVFVAHQVSPVHKGNPHPGISFPLPFLPATRAGLAHSRGLMSLYGMTTVWDSERLQDLNPGSRLRWTMGC